MCIYIYIYCIYIYIYVVTSIRQNSSYGPY
jgi:hypothetical protein